MSETNLELRVRLEKESVTKLGKQNKGYRWERTQDDPRPYHPINRELVFYEEWLKDNKPSPGWNYGFGTLQDILMLPEAPLSRPAAPKVKINYRDRYIAATIMQWLGTNIGWQFLVRTLKRCGYELVKINDK